jgi:hypothetical protein
MHFHQVTNQELLQKYPRGIQLGGSHRQLAPQREPVGTKRLVLQRASYQGTDLMYIAWQQASEI